MKKLKFDVMLEGRYVATFTMDYSPLFPITQEEIRAFVEAKRPTLKGKDFNIAI